MILADTVFVPDEKGDLVALISPISEASSQLPPNDMGMVLVKMVLTFIALVVLLYTTYWFLRRLMHNRMQKGTGSRAVIELLEKRMISPKTMLYLVRVDDKKILFAESHLEIKALANLPMHTKDNSLCADDMPTDKDFGKFPKE